MIRAVVAASTAAAALRPERTVAILLIGLIPHALGFPQTGVDLINQLTHQVVRVRLGHRYGMTEQTLRQAAGLVRVERLNCRAGRLRHRGIDGAFLV